MSSTCFEPEGSSSGRLFYMQLWYGTFYMHRYKKSSSVPGTHSSTYQTAYTNACKTYHTVTA